ncbi:hypothetical protein L596_029415 [Steinernema carpocapsae]|uniref:Uncharacterized protein n=1 Tax=Steinernema carpocapsae TaxID=34508 RepID=A0A4V5ZXH2_STECR|nr:hypothetical protein L596_029415 [Steinernema carpocapsae]
MSWEPFFKLDPCLPDKLQDSHVPCLQTIVILSAETPFGRSVRSSADASEVETDVASTDAPAPRHASPAEREDRRRTLIDEADLPRAERRVLRPADAHLALKGLQRPQHLSLGTFLLLFRVVFDACLLVLRVRVDLTRGLRGFGLQRKRVDLNQPVKIPVRSGGADAFLNDSPLTQVGSFSAQLIGRGLKMRQLTFHTVYCSPALRCVQTAHAIISMMQLKQTPKICVEPGLFEPLMFYWQGELKIDRIPSFMTNQELVEAGFNVDTGYEPVISVEKLKQMLFQEKRPDDSFRRISQVADSIVEYGKDRQGGILVVTHAPSLDILLRQITGRQDRPRTMGDLQRMTVNYPFCSTSVLELEQPSVSFKTPYPKPQWVHKQGVLPPLTCVYTQNSVEVQDFS